MQYTQHPHPASSNRPAPLRRPTWRQACGLVASLPAAVIGALALALLGSD